MAGLKNTNAKRGAYFKNKTRRWLESKGYQVADMEVVRTVGPMEKRFNAKRDQFGSDLLGIHPECGFLFVQVKSGNVGGKFLDAKRKFMETKWPTSEIGVVSGGTAFFGHWYRRIVVAWAPRARAPRIVEC